MLSRRNFLKLMGASALAGYGFHSLEDTTTKLETEKIDIQIKNLPKDFNNYRIAFLSDIHMGPLLKEEVLDRSLQIVKDEKPDLFLLGGDYVGLPDNAISRAFVPKDLPNFNYLNPSYTDLLFERFHAQLKELNIKDGIFGVLGNHDRWSIEGVCQKAMNTNWSKLLVNEEIEIKRGASKLKLLGVDDYWTGIPKIPRGLTLKKNEFRILLAHNPDYVSFIEKNKNLCEVNFALSGHTHAGQIRLGIIGHVVRNVHDHRLIQGLVQLADFPIYISRGLGVVELPYRVNCTPEITIFTLKS